MPQPEQLLLTYLHLAQASQSRNQLMVRDKLLILAGVEATGLGWDEVAEGCRTQVLAHNPRHLVRRWENLGLAVEADRFESYFKQLRRKYSPERAEHMLQTLDISLATRDGQHVDPRDRAAALIDKVAQWEMSPVDFSDPAVARGSLNDSWTPFWWAVAVLIALALVWTFGKLG
jgi:hypothetical protein